MQFLATEVESVFEILVAQHVQLIFETIDDGIDRWKMGFFFFNSCLLRGLWQNRDRHSAAFNLRVTKYFGRGRKTVPKNVQAFRLTTRGVTQKSRGHPDINPNCLAFSIQRLLGHHFTVTLHREHITWRSSLGNGIDCFIVNARFAHEMKKNK